MQVPFLGDGRGGKEGEGGSIKKNYVLLKCIVYPSLKSTLICSSIIVLLRHGLRHYNYIPSCINVLLRDDLLHCLPQTEAGCLLPSLPSDATFDSVSGISFLCDLNDNIPAPWPSTSQLTSSSCNKCTYTLLKIYIIIRGELFFIYLFIFIHRKKKILLFWIIFSFTIFILIHFYVICYNSFVNF